MKDGDLKTMFSSDRDDWETPQDLFDKLNTEFHFTLDAAASDTNHKCEHYYTIEDNALQKDWDRSTFVNPPYGKDLGKWVEKCFREAKKGNTVVMLVFARTDTKWFHDYVYHKAEIRFLRGRLKFGGSVNNAPFPSMVVIYHWWDVPHVDDCPHCGGKAEVRYYERSCLVVCTRCRAQSRLLEMGINYSARDVVIDEWNRRDDDAL